MMEMASRLMEWMVSCVPQLYERRRGVAQAGNPLAQRFKFCIPTVDSEPQTVGNLSVMTRVSMSLECSPLICYWLFVIATTIFLLFAMITNMSNQFIGIF